MNIETIMQLVTVLVTLILGVISKKSKFINNNLIPVQNIVIGLVMALIQWIMTNDISLAIALSGLCAGGTYDFIKNLNQLRKPQEVVGDEPIVFEEVDNGESND